MNLSSMDIGLLVSLGALFVSGLAAVVAMWVERDSDRPLHIFTALAILCLLTTGVSIWQELESAAAEEAMEESMANVLQKLDAIMQKEAVEVPAINDLVKSELAAASRAQPRIVKKMAQRVADEGGDPSEVLGSYLPAADLQGMQRRGALAVKPAAQPGDAQTATPEPRRALNFGGGPARMLADAAAPAPAPPAPVAPPVVPPAPEVQLPPPAPEAAVTPAASDNAKSTGGGSAGDPRKKAVRKTPTSRGDIDIYEEAEEDLRRKTP